MSQLTQAMNALLADSLVLYVKLHNYHWNVSGPQFDQIHAKTEALYTQIATFYDDIAERILQLGDKPIITMKSVLETATLQEEPHDHFNDREVIHGVVHDFEHIHRELKRIAELDSCDAVTTGFIDDQCAMFEKELWMLKASLDG